MSKPITLLTVTRSERLSPGMVRLHFEGDLAAFAGSTFTDRYVKLVFGDPAELERGGRPTLRTYTAVDPDVAAGTLKIDFVVHGTEGVAGPWAATAMPGDSIHVRGPGGAYAPDPTADWHLLAGDESALPAIAAALERLPAGAPAKVFLEVDGPADELALHSRGAVELCWLHRGARRVGDALVAAVRDLDFPPGAVHAFVHGEATFVKELRRLLRIERGVPREMLSISGYWRLGMDDEGWRASKPEWKRQVEAEEALAA